MQRLRICSAKINLTAPVAPAVNQFTDALDFTAENVLAENIYELTVTFLVQKSSGSERYTIGRKSGAAVSCLSSKVTAYADNADLQVDRGS